MRAALIALLRPLFHFVDARLDRSRYFCNRWQALKWRIKYWVGSPRYTPPFETLLLQPHRRWLVDAVLAFGVDAGGVLDVGCGKAQNLVLLAQARPGIRLEGIDISHSAIEAARVELDSRNLARIKVGLGGTDDLSTFDDGTFDVVVSDAVLMYLSPEQLSSALREMLRIARKGLVLGTWHQEQTKVGVAARYDEGAWIHDYRRLLGNTKGIKVDIQRYPEGTWQDARWLRYGVLVVVSVLESESDSDSLFGSLKTSCDMQMAER